jgi:endonuclease/exonuclease/phosphatase family metal-dependent hydrolase
MLRIATFNLENLFTRPSAMNLENDSAGAVALEDQSIANLIISKDDYSDDDKIKLLELTKKYKWHELNQPQNSMVQLQKVRGRLFSKKKDGTVEVVVDGRKDWVGWFELRRDDVKWKATYNTGRVIEAVRPDILITVEVENRPTLEHFNNQVLKSQFNFSYPYYMVIDGNDQRGIDLGIMSRYPIREIRSHVDDINDSGNKIFSRDCPEFDILLPSGKSIVVIPNHLKSKRNGNDLESMNKRAQQADRAHNISLKALERTDYVLVGGDLNDTPDSQALQSLFSDGFQDVQTHPTYPKDRPGTYETGLAENKIDYLIMSEKLFVLLNGTGIERRGCYHPRTWQPFDTVEKSIDEASDHHLVWADLLLS